MPRSCDVTPSMRRRNGARAGGVLEWQGERKLRDKVVKSLNGPLSWSFSSAFAMKNPPVFPKLCQALLRRLPWLGRSAAAGIGRSASRGSGRKEPPAAGREWVGSWRGAVCFVSLFCFFVLFLSLFVFFVCFVSFFLSLLLFVCSFCPEK